MTHPTLTCEQFADSLADLLERDVSEATRSAMETHAVSCGDCGPLLADIRKLRLDAANLPQLEPSRDLWSGIASRIETPVVELGTTANGGTAQRRTNGANRRSQLWMGLAAAGLVAITASVTYQITKRGSTLPVASVASTDAPIATLSSPARTAQPTPSRTPAPAAAPSSVRLVSTKPTAEQTYDSEIRRLRALVSARRNKLDTATVAVIDKNLKIIDDAIAQCRAALARDPHSQYLLESLNDALDNKVQLLRTAATLPVRM